MALGKSYKVWQKLNSKGPYSVLLEQRNRAETLLFESTVVAALGRLIVLGALHLMMFQYL